jgi:hypothetical protein
MGLIRYVVPHTFTRLKPGRSTKKNGGCSMEDVEPKVNIDMANAEFNRFTEAMDLDLDTDDMDEEDLTQFTKQKKKIINALMDGSLIINNNGEAVYTPRNPKSKREEPITFNERSGVSVMAMDGKKKNYDVRKTYAIMAEMCKVHQSVFANLVGIDIKTCEAIFSLLMD